MPNSEFAGKPLEALPTPCFVVDLDAVRSNCSAMRSRAAAAGLELRGHIKTHKTAEAAEIQAGGTKRCMVTSTFPETDLLCAAGFDDVLYGYPLIEEHMDRNYLLASKMGEYHLLVHSSEAVGVLRGRAPPPGKKWSVFLAADCGYGREGLRWDSEDIVDVARDIMACKDRIFWKGIYVHCGNSYSGGDPQGVKKIRDDTISNLLSLRRRLGDHFGESALASVKVGFGSTPSCSQVEGGGGAKFDDLVGEMHPGNYVFYDAMQWELGSCQEKDIAGRVMTRVLAQYPKRGQLLIDCGFLGLTQQGFAEQGGTFARVQGHPELKLVKMTQEIGTIEAAEGHELDLSLFPAGAMLFLLPFHSCAAAACYPNYYVHENGIVKEEWVPCKGW